jgi:hypothetical protein
MQRGSIARAASATPRSSVSQPNVSRMDRVSAFAASSFPQMPARQGYCRRGSARPTCARARGGAIPLPRRDPAARAARFRDERRVRSPRARAASGSCAIPAHARRRKSVARADRHGRCRRRGVASGPVTRLGARRRQRRKREANVPAPSEPPSREACDQRWRPAQRVEVHDVVFERDRANPRQHGRERGKVPRSRAHLLLPPRRELPRARQAGHDEPR